MTQVPPGQQRGQYGRQPGHRPGAAVHERRDEAADRVAHPPPDAGREHDRDAQPEQPDPVPAVLGIEVARAVPEPPRREAGTAGDHHPRRRERVPDPLDQDQDGIAGLGPGRRPPALAGPAPVAFARVAVGGRAATARRGRSGSRTGLAGASRGAGFAPGRPVRLRADILGAAAARAVVALGRTGGHDDQANEHPVPAEGPARACRPIPGQPRWPLPAGGTPMASLAAEKASIKPPASGGSPLRGDPGSRRAAILILWISLGGGARWMAVWSRAARR